MRESTSGRFVDRPDGQSGHVRRSVAIIGTGNVGMAAAYSLFQRRIANELVLVDLDERRTEGEAMDLLHGQSLVGRVDVCVRTTADMGPVDLVVLTAGVGQKPGETRLDLVARNVAVFESIVADLDRQCPDAVILVASNPVDVLTRVTQQLSERPNHRILGTGTTLDTSRLRALVGEHYGVDPQSVHGYVLGEHGDSEFVAWSTVNIAGVPLVDNPVFGQPWDHQTAERIEAQVRNAAQEIISRKGHTDLAIGLVIASLADTVLSDRAAIHSVSVDTSEFPGLEDVCLSLPSRLGGSGTSGSALPPLTDDELAKLHRSAGVIRDVTAR